MKRTNTAVWLEKYKRWQIKVQKNCERRTFTCSTVGRTGQRICNKKADDWLDEGLVDTNTKVKDLFETWITELKDTTSREHWQQYEGYGKNWIKPNIGKYKIGYLTEQNLQTVINAAYKKGLAKKTLNNIKSCMTAFVKYSRKCKATMLFVENLSIPNGAIAGERTILQPNDIVKLFQQDKTTLRGKEIYELFINAYRFEVVTGLRPGEIIGLKWSDISGSNIFLKRSINRLNEETRGKNDNARRTFNLTELDLAILKTQKEKLKELDIKSDYVFSDKYGEHIQYKAYYKKWIRYRNNAMMSKAAPYELRHTFVSIVKCLPEGYLKQLIGHSKDMDTYGTYSPYLHQIINRVFMD